ncbi:MAG: DUF2493 domain-containing protein [Prevotella sp.]|nr:DUF2493 domain-containing protein [Prevotella sp.]
MQNFRVIIAGGRDFNDYQLLKAKCDAILANKRQTHSIIIVSGTARGADSLGERYAHERAYTIERHPANWDSDGKAAGPIRNAQMADVADALIAFWDGRSRGTRNMIDVATSKGLLVRKVLYNNIHVDMNNTKINAKWAELTGFATQHATKEGTRRGIAWLRDSFNSYLDLSDETPGYGMGGQPGSQFNREVLAGRILQHFKCVGADNVLDDEQLERLEESLDEIVKNGISNGIKR